MLAIRDNLAQCLSALQAHKLRASLTVLGLTMGVATLITVMTIVQGANLYIEQKVANLGTNVFQIGRMPFAVVDFRLMAKATRNKNITAEDLQAVAELCRHCQYVGAQVSTNISPHYRDKELQDSSLQGQTSNMAEIDTRTLVA